MPTRQLAGPKAAVPPTSLNSQSRRVSPTEAGPHYRFAFELPDPGVLQSPSARPPNPGPPSSPGRSRILPSRARHRASSLLATEQALPCRSAAPAGFGSPVGTPRPGRWDQRGVHGKLGGREAGPAGRQRRPMGSAEHDVTALITAWLWLTKRTMRLPSSPLPPRKKMLPRPRSPLGQGGMGAVGARARPGCQSPAWQKPPGGQAPCEPNCPSPPGFLRAAAPFFISSFFFFSS